MAPWKRVTIFGLAFGGAFALVASCLIAKQNAAGGILWRDDLFAVQKPVST
jgi:hypothetical protein